MNDLKFSLRSSLRASFSGTTSLNYRSLTNLSEGITEGKIVRIRHSLWLSLRDSLYTNLEESVKETNQE